MSLVYAMLFNQQSEVAITECVILNPYDSRAHCPCQTGPSCFGALSSRHMIHGPVHNTNFIHVHIHHDFEATYFILGLLV